MAGACGADRRAFVLLLAALAAVGLALLLVALRSETARADHETVSFTQVSVGWAHSCGLTSTGAIECWGDNRYGQASPPSGGFTQVSAGEVHSCGLTSAGVIKCWGADWFGQAGCADERRLHAGQRGRLPQLPG